MNTKFTRRNFVQTAAAAAGLAIVGKSNADEPAASAAKPEFGFSLNTATIRGYKLKLPEQIDLAIKAGYGGIEPWLSDLEQFSKSGGSLGDLKKKCADAGLNVQSAIGFAQWVVNDDAQRAKGVEQMKRDMDLVAQLGGTHIAAPPAGAYKEPKLKLDDVAERYRAILELGGYREQFKNAEDYDLWLRVSRSLALANVPVPLLRYRFSTTGMTLSRKWQQLYFVYLAQAAHREPDAGFDEWRRMAETEIAATDRAQFFQGVLRGTLDELVSLGMWDDAWRLVWSFRHDVGQRHAMSEAWRVARQLVRAANAAKLN